ncbi:class I SAM-dependent methyltransferase [bacterium]|nr:MAG: class I SAM-dependent methyltransferase [bacterium]
MTFSPTENAACPVCGAREAQPLQTLRDRLWSRPGVFQMARCQVCSHGFLAVRPTQEGMGAYYEGLYDEVGVGIEEKLQRSVLAQMLNWRRMRALNARRRFRPGARHLDVGCGVSSLLRQLAARGLAAVGLDFEEAACQSQRAYCEGLDVELWRGTLDEAYDSAGGVVDEGRQRFASASMIHYLEHTFTPVEDLRRVYQRLEPGGAIVVEVPSIESFHRSLFQSYWLPYLPPQHISLFSRRSLRRAFKDAGFVGVRVRGASAPFIGLSSFAIWWTWVMGRKSSLSRPVQTLAWPLAFLWGAVVLLGDLGSFWLLAKSGHADHLRVTAVKPR